MRHAPVWALFEAVAPTLAYDSAALGDGSAPRDLAVMAAMPTIVLNGEARPPALRDAAAALAGAIPQGGRRTLAGQTPDVSPRTPWPRC